MNTQKITLFDIKKNYGDKLIITEILGGNAMRERLLHLGIKEGDTISVLHYKNDGPCVIIKNQTKLVIGAGMSKKILVEMSGDSND